MTNNDLSNPSKKKTIQSKSDGISPKMALGSSDIMQSKLLWQILTGVFAFLFILTLILGSTSQPSKVSSVASIDDAKKEMSGILEMLLGNSDFNISSIKEVSGLYEYTINASGQEGTLYSTDDLNLYIGFSPTPITKAELKSQIELAKAQREAQDAQAKQDDNMIVNMPVGDDPSIGDQNAPVTVIEFSDFQCPFCGKFYSETYKPLYENYIKTGKVRFVYKDYPLVEIHPYAQKAAEAANCAMDQNKYWEMHDLLFTNQNALDIQNLRNYAKTLGLDTNKFDTCLDTDKYANEISGDKSDLESRVGRQGTPYILINGRQIKGAYPYSQIKTIIDQEIAKASS